MSGWSLSRRSVLAGGLALTTAAAAAAAAASPLRVVVSASGRRGTLPSVGEAIEQARRVAAPNFTIALEPGVYREKLEIDVPGLTILGLRPGAVVTYDAGAQLPGPNGVNWGTSGSATLTIRAPGVTLRDLVIRNDHDFRTRPMQAVALAVQAGGDRCRIERCAIEGFQDTLLLQARSRVTDCRIAGNVDFVFGGAAAWIERCEIVSRPNGAGGTGFVAAPSTPACQPQGLVFADCRLIRERGVPDGSVYLGRPWRAGGNMRLLGAATFLRCWMDAHIAEAGWTSMGYRDPQGVQRQLMPLEARLYEHGSRGPGAKAAPTRRQLDPAVAARLNAQLVFAAAEQAC